MLRKIVSEVNSLGMQITKDEWRKCRDAFELLQSLNRYLVGGGKPYTLGGYNQSHVRSDEPSMMTPTVSTISALSSSIRGGGASSSAGGASHRQREDHGAVPLSRIFFNGRDDGQTQEEEEAEKLQVEDQRRIDWFCS